MVESETRMRQGRTLGPAWRKSSYCAANECMEVRELGGTVEMRSSTAPGVVLRCTAAQFRSLLQVIKVGELDHG
jgi:Domain of unknown function (DUF397)